MKGNLFSSSKKMAWLFHDIDFEMFAFLYSVKYFNAF